MASLASIRKRIRSTKSTQQITKAMKMVSAAKLRGAEERLMKARPYAKMLDTVIADLARRTDLEGYDLVQGREEVKKSNTSSSRRTAACAARSTRRSSATCNGSLPR
ncbi:MAG: F0F1 ATP synthase subunit gamma [Deltaproteobacteria bacterium]|nr:F0F1 ATP synthase subunit gamma [Deltaproteobacteria bacterium]